MSDPADPRDPAFLYDSISPDVSLPAEELRAFFAQQHPLIDGMAQFRRTYHIYRNVVERYFQSQGVTHLQYATLLALCAREGDTPFSVGELAQHFHIAHPACVQLCDRMEEKGLVARIEEGNTKRVIATESGMNMIYRFLMARRPFFPPPLDLRGQLMRAIVHASRLEYEFFTARGVAYPRTPFIEQDRDQAEWDAWEQQWNHPPDQPPAEDDLG